MRLLDRLLSDGFDPGPYFDKEYLVDALTKCQLVVADNVQRYMLENKAGEPAFPSDYPCVMLPFEYTFVEMRFPRSTEMSTWAEDGGVLLSMKEPKAPEKSDFVSDYMIEWLTRPEVKYHLHAVVFFNLSDDGPSAMCKLTLPVDESGRVTTGDDTKFHVLVDYCLPVPGYEDVQALIDEHLKSAGWIILPALMAISFMHCRNVTVKKETPPLPLSKKHQKRTGRPLLRYHVLQIDHMKQVLEREGHASKSGLKQALHICRGHFKHYGRDGKGLLFGKYTATVWIPMHTRGSLEEGVVVKDYNVK